MDLTINNRYKIIRPLGKGGMGEVFLIEDLFRSNMQFALKSIKVKFLENKKDNALQRFKQEYEVMTRLKHPNLTRVFDFGQIEGGDYFIVMEYVDGITLKDLLVQKGKFSINEVLEIFVPLLRAVEFIHSRNIIYRDIKPENVIVQFENDKIVKIKLLDFGLADLGDAEKGQIKGTIQYMAPEIIKAGKIDHRADIFSLGILFYELLTGMLIYSDTRMSSILTALSKEIHFNNILDSSLLDIYSDNVKTIIHKASAYKAEERYQSASDLISSINILFNKDYEIETKQTKEAYILGVDFVGREKELKILKEIIKNSNKKLNLITGTTGVGKSRLIEETQKYCSLNDIKYYQGNSSSSTSYESFLNILEDILYHFEDAELKNIGCYLKIILPNHPRLAQCEIKSTGDAKTDKDLLVVQISNLIMKHAEKQKNNLIIFLNNLHNADEVSLEILNELLYKLNNNSNNAKISLIAECGDEEKDKIATFMNKLSDKHRLNHIVIDAFSEEETAIYIRLVFGKDKIHHTIMENISALRKKVGGNPLFLQELVKSLVEEEIITVLKSLWVLKKSIGKIELPQNVSEIIKLRISKLQLNHNEEQAFKLLGSLNSMEVSPILLKKITYGYLTVDWNHLLNYLYSKEILFYRNDLVIASSKLIGEAIRSKINQKEKYKIHGFLAVKLEQIFLNKNTDINLLSDEEIEELAYHYSLIELKDQDTFIDKTLYYLMQAVERSDKKYANKKSIIYYHTVLELIDCSSFSNDKITEILMICLFRMGKIESFIGKKDAAYQSFYNALNLAKQIKSSKYIGNCLISIASLFHSKSDYKKAEEIIKEALKELEQNDDTLGIASAYKIMAVTLYRQGKNELALEKNHIALKYFKKCHNKIGIADININLGNILVNMKENNRAMKCYKKTLEIGKEINSIKNQADAYSNIGIIYYQLNDFKKAIRCYEKGLLINESIGHKNSISSTLANIGNIHFDIGDFAKAFKTYERSLKIKKEIGDKLGESVLFCNIANTYNKLLIFDKAKEYYDHAIDLARSIGANYFLCLILMDKSTFLYEHKNYSESLKNLNEVKLLNSELKNSQLLFTPDLFCTLNEYQLSKEDTIIKTKYLLNQLNKIIKNEDDKENLALAYYYVWEILTNIENSQNFKKDLVDTMQIAHDLYKELYSQAPKIDYKEKIDKINKFRKNYT